MKIEDFYGINLFEFGKKSRKPDEWFNKKAIIFQRQGNYFGLEACRKIRDAKPSGLGEIVDKQCSCSQKEIRCGHTIDGGGVSDYHWFWHLCLSCLDAKASIYVVEPDYETEADYCCSWCENNFSPSYLKANKNNFILNNELITKI